MNFLKQCTFIDHFNDSFVELEDILEEHYNKSVKHIQKENENQIKNDDINIKNKTDDLLKLTSKGTRSFYLIIYFSANWLPDNSNHDFNRKLEKFYTNNRITKQFEIIFISFDKTFESYQKFLDNNKFIRYTLSFEEKETKVCWFSFLFVFFSFYLKFCFSIFIF
jgi:hypothetical protein